MSRRQRRKRSALQRAAIGLGIVLIATAGGFEGYVLAWENHSAATGHALISRLKNEQNKLATNSTSPTSCTAASSKAGPTTPKGILTAPSIGLQAPVLQGTSDTVLSTAVGHDPYSVWPGETGNAVLLAHDVSYFVNIDHLHRGDLVRYETACNRYVFKVTSHRVVKQGSPVYNTRTSSMTFVTCWPTDALWFTPDRYLVTLTAVSSGPIPSNAAQRHVVAAGQPVVSTPTVPAPAALVGQGLTLSTNSIPMGTMTVAGNPSRTWLQSPGPLDLESASLESYIGAVKALAGGNTTWWNLLAPGVQAPASLTNASSISYQGALDVIVKANGETPTGAVLSTTVNITGGKSPGSYHEIVSLTVKAGSLLITSWSMTPSG